MKEGGGGEREGRKEASRKKKIEVKTAFYFGETFQPWSLVGKHHLFTEMFIFLNSDPVPDSPRASQVSRQVKNPPASAGDTEDPGLMPESGRSPGQRNGYPLQYSCLGNPMGQGFWWATVHGVAESDMTERLSTHAHQLAPLCLGLHQSAFLSGTKDISLLPIRTPDWCNARGQKHVSPGDKGACGW